MKLLYWEPCYKKFTETLPLSGKVIEHHRTRELKSDHPLVGNVWFTAGTSAIEGDPIVAQLNILTKDMQGRKSIEVSPEQMESLDIPEAIEFIQSLKTEPR